MAEIDTARDYITEEAVVESATRVVPAGAVLVTTRVSVGKTAVAGCPLCFSQDITAINIYSSAIALPAYVALFLRSRKEALLQKNQGSTIAGITRDSLALEQIPLPPLSEQKRIVDILQEAEAIRRLRTEAETRTAELIPAMFQIALDQNKTSRKRQLGRWFESKPNYGTMTPAEPDPGSDGVICLRVGNIQNNRIDLSDIKYVQRSSIQADKHTLRTGDIILARAIASEGHLGKAVVITDREHGYAFDSHLMRIRLRKRELVPEFLQVYLYSKQGRSAFLKIARQSAVQFNVNAEEMSQVLVPDVDPTEQNRVVQTIQEAETIYRMLDDSAKHVSQLQTAICARAFSGQLTAEWREANADLLAREARERDEALRQAGASQFRSFNASIQDEESAPSLPTDGIYSDLNREQRDLLRFISELVKQENRYFSADQIAGTITGELRGHPNAIANHLNVLIAHGFVVMVSLRKEQGGWDHAHCYRLPKPEDDVRIERLESLRRLADLRS